MTFLFIFPTLNKFILKIFKNNSKFILLFGLSTFLSTSNAYSLDCMTKCGIYGGLSTVIVQGVVSVYNPILGQWVPYVGIPLTAYTCDYICNEDENKGKLCLDKELYTGDGAAAMADPKECIMNPYEPEETYIDESCNGNYSDEELMYIIDADSENAFYECGTSND